MGNSAAAQLLTYDEIIDHISGKWAVPIEVDNELIKDCDRYATNIWLREEDGQIVYYSQVSGSEIEGAAVTERSVVKKALGDSGQEIPAVLIRYDGETRLTESGDPFEWRLYMMNKNAFTWQATHWGWTGSTPIRERCPEQKADS